MPNKPVKHFISPNIKKINLTMMKERELNKVETKLLAEEETSLIFPQLLAQTSYLMCVKLRYFKL